MNMYENFTSLPPDQERSFLPFEQRMAEAEKKGLTTAIIAAIVVFIIAIGIYVGVEPTEDDISKDFNMSNLARPTAPPAQK